MFETLPSHLHKYGIKADVRTLLLFQKAVSRGLVHTLGDVYNVFKALAVKEHTQIGPFTKAFYAYFLDIEIPYGQPLDDAIAKSETFKNWRKDHEQNLEEKPNLDDLISRFLDEVHFSTYDIKEVLDGKEIWENDNPELQDTNTDQNNEQRNLEKIADYSGLSLEELLERMKKIQDQQKSRHAGGSHWIGSGGISAYGNGGAAKGGIRVGGTGGGKMARTVMGDPNFYPVDLDRLVNDNNIDAALASLKGIMEESAHDEIDIENTIKLGIKRGGLFMPEIKKITEQKLQVILLIDNGGYSMMAYVKTVQELFKKMKTRFAHDLETYYFHNTVYDLVYSDAQRTQKVKLESILSKSPDYRVFIIGDATMGAYEITSQSISAYQRLKEKFKKVAWLNPEPLRYWPHTISIQIIKELIDMYPMTPKGIEQAVSDMNRKMVKL